MTKRKVGLDAGHGRHDNGAAANGLKEKDLTLDIAKRIHSKLKPYDIEVVMTRTSDKYLTLSERADIANRNNVDLFLSIHINAGGGTGFESFIYNGTVSNATKNLQNTVHDAIVKQINVTDRGKKSANFAVVRQTKMPSLLTENLFIDHKEDADKLKDSKFLDKIAQGHVDGILAFFKIKKGNTTKTPTETIKTKPKKQPSKSSYTGDSVVDYLKTKNQPSSFAHRKKLAQQHGIKNYTGTAAQNTRLLNALRGGKTATSTKKYTPKYYKVGSKVKIKPSAKTYSRSSAAIPSRYKNKTFTIQQVGSNDVLIKELYSWVRKSDLV